MAVFIDLATILADHSVPFSPNIGLSIQENHKLKYSIFLLGIPDKFSFMQFLKSINCPNNRKHL